MGSVISYVDVSTHANLAKVRRSLLDTSLHLIPSILDSHGEVMYWLHLSSAGSPVLDISRIIDGTGRIAERLMSPETQGLRLTVVLVGDGDMESARRREIVRVVQ